MAFSPVKERSKVLNYQKRSFMFYQEAGKINTIHFDNLLNYFTFYRVADLWVPNVFRTTLYSEILDKYFNVVVTEHALKQIDKCYGLDHYILRTPIQDLQSQLALTLRRKMLIALAENSYHPNDPEKAKIVYETYKDCIIPVSRSKNWLTKSIN